MQDPEDTMLKVLASQTEQTLDPAGANFPAGHQAHARYDPAPTHGE
jgi:hypothetical protein